jgi:hypothetical protein
LRTRSVTAAGRLAAPPGACQLTVALGGGHGTAGAGAARQIPATRSVALTAAILNKINLLRFIFDHFHHGLQCKIDKP